LLERVAERLPGDPVHAGWYIRGVAEALDVILYDVGLGVLATRLADAAHEARENGDLEGLRDELRYVIATIREVLGEERRRRAEAAQKALRRIMGSKDDVEVGLVG